MNNFFAKIMNTILVSKFYAIKKWGPKIKAASAARPEAAGSGVSPVNKEAAQLPTAPGTETEKGCHLQPFSCTRSRSCYIGGYRELSIAI